MSHHEPTTDELVGRHKIQCGQGSTCLTCRLIEEREGGLVTTRNDLRRRHGLRPLPAGGYSGQ